MKAAKEDEIGTGQEQLDKNAGDRRQGREAFTSHGGHRGYEGHRGYGEDAEGDREAARHPPELCELIASPSLLPWRRTQTNLMGLSVLDQGPSSSASGDQKSEQFLELEALDANVMGQLAQICSEHSDGQATLRDTLGSQGEEHGSVREASLQDMDAMLQAEVAMMSDQQSDHKSAQLLSLEALDANVKFHLDQVSKDHIGGHTAMRDLLGSQAAEHGNAPEASLQDMDSKLQLEIVRLSDEHSDH